MKAEFLILFFFYLVSIFSTLGYGLYFQKITNPTINKKCLGYSGIIGVFFLTIYSYFSNFFYEHGIHHNLIILVVGLFLFYLGYTKKLFVYTELKVLLTIFSILFLSFLVFKTHDDFPYYHFPYAYYLTQHSNFIGIGQFDHGFRTPSSLFYFNSLFYLPVIKYHLFHIGSAIIYGSSILILLSNIRKSYENKRINYHYFFDLLSLIFIIVFFYRLAEHGTDRSAQILILLIISEIFLVFTLKRIEIYEISKLSILFAITISLKAFYFLYSLLLIPLLIIVLKQSDIKNLLNKIFSNKSFYFSILLIILVLITNVFNTGCIIYPLVNSCFTNLDWGIPSKEVEMMALHYENWSKAGRTPNFIIDDPGNYVKNFNWVSGWFERYFFFKFSDFLLGLIFLLFIFFITFYSKNKIKKKINKEVIYIFFAVIILLLEWFINHPTLRYGGYSLIAISFLIPFSLILERFKINLSSVKKKTLVIVLIGFAIFLYRNINRIVNEHQKYDYKVFLSPYYKVEDNYFRYEKRINNLIKNYNTCEINKSLCDKQIEALILKKKLGKYIIKRKND